METLNYEKYENMGYAELKRSLNYAEKRKAKLEKQSKENKDLIAYLKAKVKKPTKKPKYEFIPIEKASCIKNARKIWESMTQEERDRLDAELQADINRTYDD